MLSLVKSVTKGIIVQKPRSSSASSDLLTVGEVAQYLNVHPNTVRRWAGHGTLKALRLGSRRDRRFSRFDIEHLLQGDNVASTDL